jgi:nicotinate dehydrogenase subunit A
MAPAETTARRDGPDPESFRLQVNGTTRVLRCRPDTPLLYLLRNDLGLVGTRFGCGLAQCGACFVLVDGRAVPSCDLPVWAAEGKAVRTVEDLAGEAGSSELQQAFLAEQAAQCGYCTSGILISATALLAGNPDPDEAAVRAALEPNLCRCGSQPRVIRAVLRAAGALRESRGE